MNESERRLPNLLYVGDVPVEASYHGSALLYRLLERYPADRLRIVEGNLLVSLAARRIAGVAYQTLKIGFRRPLFTRFARWYSSWLHVSAERRAMRVEPLLGDFVPEAVLTVTHGYSWMTAASFASRHSLPLHLICHDDWPAAANLLPMLRPSLDARFGAIYRQASSRLCVSPAMRDEYRNRYGVDGDVLYPSRAADCPAWEEPPCRLGEAKTGLTVAFGGTVNSAGYVDALKSLAAALAPIGGRLLMFGPITPADARREGLDLGNVELRGVVASEELMRSFRDEVDVLFVPMSFSAADRANMVLSFPSKLTDYTAVGVPLLIYGPAYCSAIRWARENPGVAEVVDQEDASLLGMTIRKLAVSPATSIALGKRALDTGARYFAHAVVCQTFETALTRSLLDSN